MRSVLLEIGAPPDGVAWTALALAVVALVVAFRPPAGWIERIEQRPWPWVLALAALAALLSAGYIAHYLRGGPRIIDATSYYLEARALAEGSRSFDVPDPSGSFRGRFLVNHPESTRLSVIFPPGYPALLALGFLLRAPLAVGPAIAAALVIATYVLALQLFGSTRIALGAAVLGVLCAALRYHTADTMSHGLGALLLVSALAAATRGGRWLLLAGIAIGWLIATRPVTGAAGSLLLLAAMPRREPSAFAWLAVGMMPGLGLLLAHQGAATGSIWQSSQRYYYALADGPLDCFRYGFGAGIGCRFEHGDFVRERLPNGFGFVAALGTTLRRLHHHLLDVGNAEPLALLVPLAVVIGRAERAVRVLALGVGLLVIAYVPFYFDGTYPGGGARFYAEALALEHVLIAWLLERWRTLRFAPPLALFGFAVHASFSHLALRDREGGRPMFEPSALEAANVRGGLVFVDTDHGFNLGHAPGSRSLVVARHRGDAHDWVLWQRLGRPASYRYLYDPWADHSTPRLEAYVPVESRRFEAEAEWPPMTIYGGFAYPDFPGGECVSGGRALRVVPVDPAGAALTVEVLAQPPGRYRLVTGWVGSESSTVSVDLNEGETLRGIAAGHPGAGCFELVGDEMDWPATPAWVEVRAVGQSAFLDYVELRKR